MKVIKRITYQLDFPGEPDGRQAEFFERQHGDELDTLQIEVQNEQEAQEILQTLERSRQRKADKPEQPKPSPVTHSTATQPVVPTVTPVPALKVAPVQPAPPAKPARREVFDKAMDGHRLLREGEAECPGKAKDYAAKANPDAPCGRAVIPGGVDAQGRPSCDFHSVSFPLKVGKENGTDSAQVAGQAPKAAETAPPAILPPDGQGQAKPPPETPGKAVSADQNPPPKGSPTPASTPSVVPTVASSGGAAPSAATTPSALGYDLPPHVVGAQMLRDVVSFLRDPPPKGQGVTDANLLGELEKLKPHISCVRQVKDLPKRLERVLIILGNESTVDTSVANA